MEIVFENPTNKQINKLQQINKQTAKKKKKKKKDDGKKLIIRSAHSKLLKR